MKRQTKDTIEAVLCIGTAASLAISIIVAIIFGVFSMMNEKELREKNSKIVEVRYVEKMFMHHKCSWSYLSEDGKLNNVRAIVDVKLFYDVKLDDKRYIVIDKNNEIHEIHLKNKDNVDAGWDTGKASGRTIEVN